MRISLRLLLAGFVFAESAPAVTLAEVSPMTSSVTIGQTLSVSLIVNTVVDLYAFQADILFNPHLLSAQGISAGPFLSDGLSFYSGVIDNGAGQISFIADSLLGAIPGKSGTGTLATVQFRAVGLGSSQLEIANLLLLDSSLADIASDTGVARVEVIASDAPEPTGVILASSALLVLAGVIGKVKMRVNTETRPAVTR